MDLKLVVQTPDRDGHEIPILGEEFVIGRDYSCQLRLTHPDIGLRHCRIRRDGASVTVEDLESAMGTEVNGRHITTVEVRHGDRLQVGCEVYLISLTTEPSIEPGPDGLKSIDGVWIKLRVADGHGIAVVSFADIALINEIEIRQVDRELCCLIERGYNRIALDLGNVVHMSSQVIGTILKFYRKCTTDGGVLKICQIHPNLLEIFAITGVYLKVEIYPDVHTVLESAWPEPSRRPEPAPKAATMPPKNGWHPAPPKRATGESVRPAAAAAPLDDPATAIPLDDVFSTPTGRAASGPRPSTPARPAPARPAPAQANGEAPDRAKRPATGDSGLASFDSLIEGLDSVIPLDEDDAPPPVEADEADAALAALAADADPLPSPSDSLLLDCLHPGIPLAADDALPPSVAPAPRPAPAPADRAVAAPAPRAAAHPSPSDTLLLESLHPGIPLNEDFSLPTSVPPAPRPVPIQANGVAGAAPAPRGGPGEPRPIPPAAAPDRSNPSPSRPVPGPGDASG